MIKKNIKRIKKWGFFGIVIAVLFILIGLVGLIVPVFPGIIFLVIGLMILGVDMTFLHRWKIRIFGK